MINPNFFSFPVSLLLLLSFVAVLYLLCRMYDTSNWFRLLSGWKSALVLSCVAAAMMAVEGTWNVPVHYTIPFLIVCLAFISSLGMAAYAKAGRWRKSPCFLLCHFGFFLTLLAGCFGAPDTVKADLQLWHQKSENICIEKDGTLVALPFEVKLKEFKIDRYEDGVSPKQYTSVLEIDGELMETSVNSPCRYGGYNFYQSGYDTENGEYSVLLVARDPWYPLVLLGLFMMAAGSLMSLGGQFRKKIFIPVCLILAVVFTVISVARINFGTLMPALRSLWFIPHLIIYMLAYSLLALALAVSFMGRDPMKLLKVSSVLLLVGMICGAVWAKQAWGDYWTWDPKECWAAATWLLTIAGTHFFSSGENRRKIVLLFIFLSFLAMQITWYGVNYLPSASQSVHTYK